MSTQLQVGTVFIKCLKSEQNSSCATPPLPHPSSPLIIHGVGCFLLHPKRFFLAVTLDHDDATPLTVLFSVLALSLMERTPESMGEETVQSITEGGAASVGPESVTEVGTESTTREAGESCAG